jgi:hypothetical protein
MEQAQAEQAAILRDAPLRSGAPQDEVRLFRTLFAGDDMQVTQLFPDASYRPLQGL